MNNARVVIVKADGQTKLWIATAPSLFSTFPNMIWARELSDNECAAMLDNPWRVFDRPEPDGRVMIPIT